jgi:uncharacterized protein (TIGR03083 family)
MDHRRRCDLLADELERLAAAVEAADPSAPVPGCPEWSVVELARHVGGVHRWAGHHVRTLSPKRISSSKLGIHAPDDPEELPEWLRSGGVELLGTLLAADPDAEMWAWGADQHARFWSRRMLHESAIHRADAEQALGREPAFDAEVAADAVDELLENLPSAAYFSPGVVELKGNGETIGLTTDVGAAWLIEFDPEGYAWSRGRGRDATVEVRGPLTPMLLAVYRRQRPDENGLTVDGDRAVLEHWLAHSALR